MSEFAVNELVNVKGYDGVKLARIKEVMVSGWGMDYRVGFIDDGSEVVVNGYLIEKINYLEFIEGKCPKCGGTWKETVSFMTIYKDCLKCNLKQEEVRKEYLTSLQKERK